MGSSEDKKDVADIERFELGVHFKDVLHAFVSRCAVKGRASVLVVLGVGVEVERTWFCPSVLALMLRHRSCTHPHCVCVVFKVLTAVLLWTLLSLSGVRQW